LPILSFGDSDALRVGDLAVVFGYPFGRESSMNMGIISRPGRSYPDSASFDYIQTDAGAYAGGSGGPLLNSKGHVIGMITMASERGNMGFATPINVIKRILPRLANGEKLAWGWLGVQMADVSSGTREKPRPAIRQGRRRERGAAGTTRGARRNAKARCHPFGKRKSRR
jgi:serine protease Do